MDIVDAEQCRADHANKHAAAFRKMHFGRQWLHSFTWHLLFPTHMEELKAELC